jgi:hypothetical protein
MSSWRAGLMDPRRVGNRQRSGRYSSGTGDGPYGHRHRLLARHARTSSAARGRGRRVARLATQRHAPPHGGRTRGADLPSVPFVLHLPIWCDRRRTYERVAASLLPRGRFAWNAFVFDHKLASQFDGTHRTAPVPHTVRYALGENRIDLILDDGGKAHCAGPPRYIDHVDGPAPATPATSRVRIGSMCSAAPSYAQVPL